MGHVAQTTGAIRCIKDGEGGNTHTKKKECLYQDKTHGEAHYSMSLKKRASYLIALHKRAFSFSLFPLTFFHHLRHRKAHPPRCLPVDSNKFLSSGIKRKYLNQKNSFIEKKQNKTRVRVVVVFHFGSWKICKLTQNFAGFLATTKKIGRKTRRIHMSVFVCLVTSMLHSSPSSSTKERKRRKKPSNNLARTLSFLPSKVKMSVACVIVSHEKEMMSMRSQTKF